jgi:hypothetical protein
MVKESQDETNGSLDHRYRSSSTLNAEQAGTRQAEMQPILAKVRLWKSKIDIPFMMHDNLARHGCYWSTNDERRRTMYATSATSGMKATKAFFSTDVSACLTLRRKSGTTCPCSSTSIRSASSTIRRVGGSPAESCRLSESRNTATGDSRLATVRRATSPGTPKIVSPVGIWATKPWVTDADARSNGTRPIAARLRLSHRNEVGEQG